MSGATDPQPLAAGDRVLGRLRRVGAFLFGDRTGLALFLGAALWLATLWRIGIFIQDTVGLASALANVASGRLALVELPYSLTIGPQPGVYEVGGQAYGRNYGQVLLALPVLYLLEGLSWLAAPKLLLAGGWSLGLVAFGRQVAAVTGRQRLRSVATLAALVVFAGNVAAARALPDGILELVALQLTTILVGAFLAVLLYRLVARFHDGRVALAAGIGVVVATPVGFWASIPKRHVVTGAAAVLVLYLFAVSREGTDRSHLLARGGAYATMGLLTTVQPLEAFFLFVVLALVDFTTAPSNSFRGLGLVAVTFFCSLLPFFVLNTLISGNPLQSPAILSKFGGLEAPGGAVGGGGGGSGASAGGGGASGGGGTGGTGATSTDGGPSGPGLLAPIVDGVTTVFAFAWRVGSFAWEWLASGLAVLTDPERLSNVFFRSGAIPSVRSQINGYEAIELTLLESFPLLAAMAWLPVQAARDRTRSLGLSTPRRQTDVLAVGFVVVLTLAYLPMLPIRSQITVRYLLPVVPLLIYLLARLSFVRRVVGERPRYLVGGYLVTVFAAVLGVAIAHATLDLAIGEAMQLHALLGLAAAGVAVVALASWPAHRRVRILAAGLALPAGVTTAFLIFAKIQYFAYRLPGDFSPHVFALDVIRLIAEILPG